MLKKSAVQCTKLADNGEVFISVCIQYMVIYIYINYIMYIYIYVYIYGYIYTYIVIDSLFSSYVLY